MTRPPSARLRAVLLPVLLIVAARLLTLFLLFPDGRHGTTREYLSGAIGILEGRGFTIQYEEYHYVNRHTSNLTLNLDGVYYPEDRVLLEMDLPLPAYVVAGVWKVIGTRSMLGFLLFQVLVEAVILLFFLAAVRARFTGRATWILAVLLAANIPLGKRVLEVGYDVYSYFGSLLAFLAGLALLEGRPILRMLGFATGSAITLFAREINLLLLPVMAGAAGLVAIVKRNRALAARAVLLLVPFVLVVAATMAYRMDLTGNPRPTRTVFWHSFWAGVGQFSNPLGLEAPTDHEVHLFVQRNDSTITASEITGAAPDSPYETFLREQAGLLVRNHPWLLVRNTVYRIGLILSPGFYEHGEFIPRRYQGIARVLSVVFTLLVAWGCVRVGRVCPPVLALILLILLALILSFSWFYFVGRVPLVSSHVYLLPISVLLDDALGGRLRRGARASS